MRLKKSLGIRMFIFMQYLETHQILGKDCIANKVVEAEGSLTKNGLTYPR